MIREEVDRDTLVWRQGMPEWQTLESVEELHSLLEHLPPPLPDEPPPLPPPPLPGERRDEAGELPESAGEPPAGERRPPPKGRFGWLRKRPVLISIVVLAVILAVLCAIYCFPEEEPPQTTATGEVLIDANPWGRVASIRGPGDREVGLPRARTTPLIVTLPVGTYQARVEYPHTGAAQSCEFTVRPATRARCWLDLAPVDAQSYFERIGW